MNITCPELATIEETSDYGSKENSSSEDATIEGFCTVFSHLGQKGEYNW